MAMCNWCGKEMTEHPDTCAGNDEVEFPDGVKLPSLPYVPGSDRRCHDCGIAAGGKHHPGCDMERCPRCAGQIISCGCLDEENKDKLPSGSVDPKEFEREELVSDYVMKHYVLGADKCRICGNTGMINGLPCLCPNGMAIRRANR